MLPKARRLSKKHYTGYRICPRGIKQSPHLSLRVICLPTATENSKFAFIVSSKVAKKAHERNQLRRRGYGALEDVSVPIPKGLGFQIYYKKNALNLTFTQIKRELTILLEQCQDVQYE